MPNQPYDRTIFNALEKPISGDINQIESQNDFTLRNYIQNIYKKRTSVSNPTGASAASSFIGDGFQIRQNAIPGLSVIISKGLAFFDNAADLVSNISGISNLDDLSPTKPAVLVEDKVITGIASPVSGRTDIIEMKYLRRTENAQIRDILSPSTATFNSTSVNKTLAFQLDNQTVTINGTGAINYKTGVDNGSFAVPTTTSGYFKVAQLRIPAATISITNSMISDFRYISMGPYNKSTISADYSIGNNSAANTLFGQSAPPGIFFASQATTVANAYVYWIIAGNTLGITPNVSPNIQVMFTPTNAPASAFIFNSLNILLPSPVTINYGVGPITSAEQAFLASGSCNPSINVSTQQIAFRIPVQYVRSGVTSFTEILRASINIGISGA
jgi:hypothetical protein